MSLNHGAKKSNTTVVPQWCCESRMTPSEVPQSRHGGCPQWFDVSWGVLLGLSSDPRSIAFQYMSLMSCTEQGRMIAVPPDTRKRPFSSGVPCFPMKFDVPEDTQKGGPSGSVLWWCLKSKNEGTFLVGRLTEVEKHQKRKRGVGQRGTTAH